MNCKIRRLLSSVHEAVSQAQWPNAQLYVSYCKCMKDLNAALDDILTRDDYNHLIEQSNQVNVLKIQKRLISLYHASNSIKAEVDDIIRKIGFEEEEYEDD